MRQRTVSPRRRVASSTRPVQPSTHGRKLHLVLGVDPSLRGTGYGVIRLTQAGPALVAAGTIRCPNGWERSRCLAKISQFVRDLVHAHTPEVCAIEGVFYAQNLQTAIVMGEARGAALAAVAEFGVRVHEIATRKVKQAMVGYGAAQKLAVAKMVQRMLKLETLPEPDAADALALALTYAQERGRHALQPPKRL